MELLEVLEISLSNFCFIMVYIIHKMLLLLKNHLNHLKRNIFEYFFKEKKQILIFQKKFFFP